MYKNRETPQNSPSKLSINFKMPLDAEDLKAIGALIENASKKTNAKIEKTNAKIEETTAKIKKVSKRQKKTNAKIEETNAKMGELKRLIYDSSAIRSGIEHIRKHGFRFSETEGEKKLVLVEIRDTSNNTTPEGQKPSPPESPSALSAHEGKHIKVSAKTVFVCVGENEGNGLVIEREDGRYLLTAIHVLKTNEAANLLELALPDTVIIEYSGAEVQCKCAKNDSIFFLSPSVKSDVKGALFLPLMSLSGLADVVMLRLIPEGQSGWEKIPVLEWELQTASPPPPIGSPLFTYTWLEDDGEMYHHFNHHYLSDVGGHAMQGPGRTGYSGAPVVTADGKICGILTSAVGPAKKKAKKKTEEEINVVGGETETFK